MSLACTPAPREQSQIGLGTSAESVDEELARLDKARVKAVFTKISREPVGIEQTLDNPKLPTVLESPELSRALAIGQAQSVNDVPFQDRACGIHEEEAASGAKRVMDVAPEPVGMALGNVRKPERKEDDVIVAIWLPGEEIVNPELDVALAGILQLRPSEVAHLRRCIDSDHPGRHLRETNRPLARAVGKLEDVSTRRERIECGIHPIQLKTPSGIELFAQVMEPLATEPLVVLASASPIVGELLGENRMIFVSGHSQKPRLPHPRSVRLRRLA